jgi:hypothetical protein
VTTVRLLSGPAISEFAKSSDGRSFNGTCTQASAAMAYAAAMKPGMSQQAAIDLMVAMRDAMFARGECAANGGATIANMSIELKNRGAIILKEYDYANGPMNPDEMHALLKQYAGVNPIVLQVSAASKLIDAAGTHEDANVDNHAIYIAGLDTTGYITGDPDGSFAMQRFDVYPFDEPPYGILESQPIGMLILDFPKPPPIPGVTDTGSQLQWADNPHVVAEPFYSYLKSHGVTTYGAPVADVAVSPDGTRKSQLFEYTELGWTEESGVFLSNLGTTYLAALTQLDTLTKQLQLAKADIQQALAALA